MIYTEGKSGMSYAKRFNVTSVTRDKEYGISQRDDGVSGIPLPIPTAKLESSAAIILLPSTAKKKEFDFYFEQLEIKNRGVLGNQVTKYPIR